MASFKRIRFFECDAIEDPSAQGAKGPQPKGRAAREEVKASEALVKGGEKTIQDLKILRMIYLDMFFLFLGSDKLKAGESQSSTLYLTKNLVVKQEFRIHHETLYVDKFINYQKGMKLIVSMGKDRFVADNEEVQDECQLIKVWDFQSLVHSSKTFPYSFIVVVRLHRRRQEGLDRRHHLAEAGLGGERRSEWLLAEHSEFAEHDGRDSPDDPHLPPRKALPRSHQSFQSFQGWCNGSLYFEEQ